MKKQIEKHNIDLRRIFLEEDYEKFLEVIDGKEEEISKIDTMAISNFAHNAILDPEKELFVKLYQSIKYYLIEGNKYTPKMQEGLALCASKTAILSNFRTGGVDRYFSMGDRPSNQENCNPFEETFRLILNATKEEFWLNGLTNLGFRELTYGELRYDMMAHLDIIAKALNKDIFSKIISTYSSKDVVGDISADLELSNISSEVPINATLQENRGLLLNNFGKITDLFTEKMEFKMFLGGTIPDEVRTKLVTKMENQVIYAKRNIGVYEKTKLKQKKN